MLPTKIFKDLSSDQKYLYEMCHAIQTSLCLPSLEEKKLMDLAIEEIRQCAVTHESFVTTMIKGIPCHTQAVERVIQSAGRASRAVNGKENHQARVCAINESRAVLPKTNSKKDYKNYLQH